MGRLPLTGYRHKRNGKSGQQRVCSTMIGREQQARGVLVELLKRFAHLVF